jgi:integrase
MSVFLRGNTYWFKFKFAGVLVVESAKTGVREKALAAERKRRGEYEDSYSGVTSRKKRVQTFSDAAKDYLADYVVVNPKSTGYVTYAIKHLKQHLGTKMMAQINAETVGKYQVARLKQKAAPKTINEEVGELLRILGHPGELLRVQLKKNKKLRLKVGKGPGKALPTQQQDELVEQARKSRSPHIKHAIIYERNAGMRAGELKGMQWFQFTINRRDNTLIIGPGKTIEGEGRIIPLNAELLEAHEERRAWYTKTFGEIKPEWYVFPFGRRGHLNPTRPVTTLKTAWMTVKRKTGIVARFHDLRHGLNTELAETGASDHVIQGITGHVSPEMTRHYAHVRTKAKREALDAVLRKRQEDRDELATELAEPKNKKAS